MGDTSADLVSVKVGDRWRVQISWPNGTTKYFGKFGFKREALEWISEHRWLIERGMEVATIKRPPGSLSQRKLVVDVAVGQRGRREPASEQ